MTAPARAAYEAFRRAFPGEGWGPWEERGYDEQAGWASVGEAAANAVTARLLAECAEARAAVGRVLAAARELDLKPGGFAALVAAGALRKAAAVPGAHRDLTAAQARLDAMSALAAAFEADPALTPADAARRIRAVLSGGEAPCGGS